MDKDIDRFEEGDPFPGASRMNEIVDRLNALSNLKMYPEGLGTFVVTDANCSININGKRFDQIVENGVISSYFVAKVTGPA